MTRPSFEYYCARRADWRWRLRAGNGEIIAHGQGYTRKADVLRAIRTIRLAMERAPEPVRVELV